MYRNIVFDLDGTLTDSGRGILASVVYALEKLGVPVPDQETLRRFVGPPLTGSFVRYCGMTESEAAEGVRLFRERYVPIGWRENRVYPGIRPLLRELKKRGCHLYVATGKSEESALRVLRYFGLLPYLDGVAAPKPEEMKADKAKLLLSVCPDTKDTAMVGDTIGDVEAAEAAGAEGIAVTYGYGTWTEEQLAKASHHADSVEELSRILLGEVPEEKGIFLSLEGLDGCGKTTQRDQVKSIMEDLGYETVLTREPGGCPISEEIRSLLLSVAHGEMTATTEALLYAASRAQHVHDVIAPSLRAGRAVICDRFVDSSMAYQGGGRSLGVDTVYQYNEAGVHGYLPDVTVYFRIDHETSLKRRYSASVPDRMEQADASFFERTEQAFERLAAENPGRYLVLDGRGTKEEVTAELQERLPVFLQEKGLI
ncbi:MAG: dTMP kinase [Clostridium sp.]|nr:dTMP kinase [Clostridium sp.]